MAEQNGRGLLIHKKTGERHVVLNYRDIRFYEDRGFVRLTNGEKHWLDKLFSWVLWCDGEREFVVSSSKEHGSSIVWLEHFLKKRFLLHPRPGGDSRQHFGEPCREIGSRTRE